MLGLAGIGYDLLLLADPAGVPSVLALAPPEHLRPGETPPTTRSYFAPTALL